MISHPCKECGQAVRDYVALPPRKPRVQWPLTPCSWMPVERRWAAWMLSIMREQRKKGSHGVQWWRAWRNAGAVESWDEVRAEPQLRRRGYK